MRRIILLTSEKCDVCKNAIKDLIDVTIDILISLSIIDVDATNKDEIIKKYKFNEIVAPTLCLVEDDKVKECIVGYTGDYKERIRRLIK